MKVNPDYSFSSFPPVDVIVVPGGNVHDAMSDKATLTGLTERSQSAQHTLSVCTGAFILAETGMLDGKIATNFHRALDNFARDYPNIRVIDDQRYTDNGKVITSAGLSSGIDASLHLVSKISGIEHAKTVAMHIEYDWRPEHPFVRAQMADRYLPHPDYEWPEEADFQRTYNYGDADHWQVAYLATTQMTPQQLSDTVKQAMRRLDDGWQLLPAEQPSTHTLSDQNYDLKWQRQQPEALIKLTFTLAPSKGDNQYKLIMTLDKRKPL